MNELKMEIRTRQNADEKQLSVRFCLETLKENKWKIVLFIVITMLIASLLILRLPSIYEAKATLYIKEEKSAPSKPAIYTGDDEYQHTQFKILQSESLALEVIENLALVEVYEKLYPLSSSREDSAMSEIKRALRIPLIEQTIRDFVGAPEEPLSSEISADDIKLQQTLRWFKDNISINPVAKTQLVKISFQSEDPQLAMDIVNTLGELYIDGLLSIRMEEADKAITWLQSRNKNITEELALAENELKQFIEQQKTENAVSERQTPIEPSDDLKALEEVQAQRVNLETILSQVELLEVPDTSLLNQFIETPSFQKLALAEREAITSFNKVNKRYGPKHPDYIAANTSVQQAKSQIANQVQIELPNLEEKLDALKQTEASLQPDQNNEKTEAVTVELNRLKYDVTRLSEVQNLMSSRLEKINSNNNFSFENARFVDSARRPLTPMKPATTVFLLIVLMFSFIFASLVVLVVAYFSNTYRRAEEIEEELKAKLLGFIPKLSKKKKHNLPLHVYFDEKYREFTDAIDNIRTGQMVGQLNSNDVVTLITSAEPNDGTSTTSFSLSFSFGQMEKVLLIDANLRKPSIAKRFGLPPYQLGLSNVLHSELDAENCIVPDTKSGIDILPAGNHTYNMSELLTGNEFSTLIEKLKHKYTKIVIDSAPCQAQSETLTLARFADSIIFVIKAGSTKKQSVRAAVKRLRLSGNTIEGIVLNSADIGKQSD
ncbi:polysaccharide biosynthesis tyrosine autokinase [Alteromonas sp. 1_MG-2023]|uniref:GumC family protein n=1 Tax=Alteromonas sp. 1_MG-2023 TaxID=3062669 RepID=UPI0026E18FDC|nr:polysaccharide biosynthesis tyrosine autokinase [Alteromonas sp. 1_MG-2023]MDO6568793.1 polysaccharide biosynthesis tyrosine autokinase [Alteromonas sp. 1_MG-2023]